MENCKYVLIPRCEKHEINVCEYNYCKHNSLCLQGESSFVCVCQEGFFGPNCTIIGESIERKESHQRSLEYCTKEICNDKCDSKCFLNSLTYNKDDCAQFDVLEALGCEKAEHCFSVASNGHCDEECNTEEFMYDGLDCVLNKKLNCLKRPECVADYGNGVCNPECDDYECSYDGFDCLSTRTLPNRISVILLAHYNTEMIRGYLTTWGILTGTVLRLDSEPQPQSIPLDNYTVAGVKVDVDVHVGDHMSDNLTLSDAENVAGFLSLLGKRGYSQNGAMNDKLSVIHKAYVRKENPKFPIVIPVVIISLFFLVAILKKFIQSKTILAGKNEDLNNDNSIPMTERVKYFCNRNNISDKFPSKLIFSPQNSLTELDWSRPIHSNLEKSIENVSKMTDNAHESLFHTACRHNMSTELTVFLSECSPDISESDENGYNCLHIAAMANACETVNTLLNYNRNIIDNKTRDGSTALILATRFGSTECAVLLIERECLVNIMNKYGHTAIHIAARLNNIRILQIVRSSGSHFLHTLDKKKDSALHSAAREGAFEACRYLVMTGLDVETLNGNNKSAYDLAMEMGHIEVSNYFISLQMTRNNSDWTKGNAKKRRPQIEKSHFNKSLCLGQFTYLK